MSKTLFCNFSFLLLLILISTALLPTIAFSDNLVPIKGVPEKMFDSESGKPFYYYTELPDGRIELYQKPGYQDRYQTKIRPLKPSIAELYIKQRTKRVEKKVPPERINGTTDFFDSLTGKPLCYYAEIGGNIEIFKGPGFHPQTGIELRPLSKEIYLLWMKKREKSGLGYALSEKWKVTQPEGKMTLALILIVALTYFFTAPIIIRAQGEDHYEQDKVIKRKIKVSLVTGETCILGFFVFAVIVWFVY